MHDKRITGVYLRELSGAIALYTLLLAAAATFGRFLLENVALGGAITAGLTSTYCFLETAGFPKLSMFAVWCVLCLSVVVQTVRKISGR